MWNEAHSAYLESRILSADPVELVSLLYQACTSHVRDARHHLAEGDILARSQSITRASEILLELSSSLDHQRGGEISQRLASLYDYMVNRLFEANLRQSDGPLAETLGLLATLSEAWEGVGKSLQSEPAQAADMWAAPVSDEAAAPAHAWSF
jgi:flagellar protein FliS